MMGSTQFDEDGWAEWDPVRWGLGGIVPLAEASVTPSLAAAPQESRWGGAAEPLCEPKPRYVSANATLLRKVLHPGSPPSQVLLILRYPGSP